MRDEVCGESTAGEACELHLKPQLVLHLCVVLYQLVTLPSQFHLALLHLYDHPMLLGQDHGHHINLAESWLYSLHTTPVASAAAAATPAKLPRLLDKTNWDLTVQLDCCDCMGKARRAPAGSSIFKSGAQRTA